MPASTCEIVAEIDRLLEPARFDDYCVNGLQVPGPAEVRTLATGVSANAELFELAAAERANLLLVHHGLLWGSGVSSIDVHLKRRLQLLFDANIALAAYHLPLDAHAELGNNALLARALCAPEQAQPGPPRPQPTLTPFALHRGQPIGFIADVAADVADLRVRDEDEDEDLRERSPLEGGLETAQLIARVHSVTQREPLVFDAGPPRVSRLAIVSGAGGDYIADAAAAGAHALLTGEVSERAMAQAREARIHLIAAGHYATETFGVRALGERIAERFGLRHVFLDVPNPV